jgi:MYXO-CTERM domain-containing protein
MVQAANAGLAGAAKFSHREAMRRTWTLMIAALVAASCDDLRTPSGDYGVSHGDFTRLPGAPPFLVLEGTKLCDAELRCGPCDEQPAICEGVDLAIDRTAVDGCHTVEIGAPLTYTFTPRGCTTAMPAESLLVDATALSEVSARFNPPTTEADEANDPDFPTAVQGAPLPDRDAFMPLQLLAAASVEIDVELVEDTSARVVGWNPSAGVLKLEAITGAAPAVSGALNTVTFTGATAGSRASAALAIEGVDLPLADVLAVGPEAVQALEISAIFFDGGASGQFPVQVEAHARDADGKHILGLPIEWRVVAGDLVLDLGEDETPNAVAGLLECIPRRAKDSRSGVIEASYGDMKATLDVTWKGYSGDDALSAGPCDEGCGCRSGAPDGWAGLGLGLVALALRRRRRPVA